MTIADNVRRRRLPSRGVWRTTALLLLAGCAALGPPPMEPLTASALDAAQRRWEVRGADAYHVVVRVRAPRFTAAVYEVVVAAGRAVKVERNGQRLRPEDPEHYDYSVSGLFELLREDLRLNDPGPMADAPPVDLRARFEPDTGRLVQYRRTVGSARRRVLMVELLEYEALPARAARRTGETRGAP